MPNKLPILQILETKQFQILVAPRSVQHGLRANVIHGKFRGMRNDDDKKLYMNQLMVECQHNAPEEPWGGPIGLEVDFYMSTQDPKKCGRWAWDTDGNDYDNLCKSLLDALAKCKFFKNDSCIFRAKIQKLWQEESLWPRIEVKLTHYHE